MFANIFVPLFQISLAMFFVVGVSIIVASACGWLRHPFEPDEPARRPENDAANLHPVNRPNALFDSSVTTDRQIALTVWKVVSLSANQRWQVLTASVPPETFSVNAARIVAEFIGRIRRAQTTPSGSVTVAILHSERDAVLLFSEAADLLWLSRFVADVAA